MDIGSMLAQWLVARAAPEDVERDRLLDAAREEFVAHGFRRASVADIARRANVSRQTLNRRCGDKDGMISAVVVREVLGFFARLAPTLDAEVPIEDQVVELFVIGVRECRTNPVATALRAYEVESMSLNLLDTQQSGFTVVTSALAGRLVAASFPAAGARQAAELLMRITATLLVSPSEVLRTDTDEDARDFASSYFIPILNAARTID